MVTPNLDLLLNWCSRVLWTFSESFKESAALERSWWFLAYTTAAISEKHTFKNRLRQHFSFDFDFPFRISLDWFSFTFSFELKINNTPSCLLEFNVSNIQPFFLLVLKLLNQYWKITRTPIVHFYIIGIIGAFLLGSYCHTQTREFNLTGTLAEPYQMHHI